MGLGVRSATCQRAQVTAQVQVVCTYLAAQVFYIDPRAQDEADVGVTIADYALVAFNCAVFILLVIVLSLGIKKAMSRGLVDENGEPILKQTSL